MGCSWIIGHLGRRNVFLFSFFMFAGHFYVEGQEDDINDGADALEVSGMFLGCGAHKLNNSILDATRGCQFFKQMNSFCLANGGPSLSDTRWYGHQRQVHYAAANLMKLETARETNHRLYRLLDSLVVSQMERLLTRMMEFGKYFESQQPIADRLVPQVRKVQKALKKLIENENVHHVVKDFCAQLSSYMDIGRRFHGFTEAQLAAAALNPSAKSRNLLTDTEFSQAKVYLSCMQTKVQNEEGVEVPDVGVYTSEPDQPSSSGNPIDDAFQEEGCSSSKYVRIDAPATCSFVEEYAKFSREVDEIDCAFDFFRKNQTTYPLLSKVARAVLCILPSPANAERAFSRAGYLSDARKKRISIESIKLRLILD
jgi:hypothetical protein